MAILVKHNKVSTVPDSADTSLVRPSDWNADHTLTGFGTAAELDAGVPNGVATLDAGGKVPTSQIPQMGDLNYQGTWNASTNSPTLTSSTGTKGYYYVVNVAGSTNLNGITDWQVGDWAVFNGSVWQKIDNTDAVTSVNGYTGTVVLTQSDISGTANAPTNTNITSMTGITGGISSPQFIQMDNGNTQTLVAGKMWYSPNTGAWNLGMGGGNITQQVGEELFVYGKASSAITDSPLQIIYQTGSVGASGTITFAPTVSGITNGDLILGVATESLALNAFGRVTSFGIVHGITTNGTAFGETWADGDAIWYNPVTGNPTNIKPVAPNIKVQVGTLIKAGSGGSGSIQVEVNHGSVLGGTDSNVQLTSVANGNILTYDGTNAYWKNTDLAAGTGISVSKSATGVLTITNTSPSSGGTVTSVSGTAPIASTGGTTPTISISHATTSTNGYLSSTDWNNFNNKQPAGSYLTTVTASSPLSGSGTVGSPLVIAQATTSTSGYLSSTDWNTFNNKQPAGTYVTSVGATSPVTSTGGTTPTIGIPQATGSVSGYLSSTDWTTFNSKGSGTVTSVAALTLGTTGTDLSSTVANGTTTPVITLNVPTASASNRGALSSADWTTFNGKQAALVSGTNIKTVSGTSLLGSGDLGTIGVAYGGTGLTSLTANRIPYGNGTSAFANEADLNYDPSLNTLSAPQVNASNGIHVNSRTIAATYSIPSGSSAMSAGPITISSGVTVTVPTGGKWVVL